MAFKLLFILVERVFVSLKKKRSFGDEKMLRNIKTIKNIFIIMIISTLIGCGGSSGNFNSREPAGGGKNPTQPDFPFPPDDGDDDGDDTPNDLDSPLEYEYQVVGAERDIAGSGINADSNFQTDTLLRIKVIPPTQAVVLGQNGNPFGNHTWEVTCFQVDIRVNGQTKQTDKLTAGGISPNPRCSSKQTEILNFDQSVRNSPGPFQVEVSNVVSDQRWFRFGNIFDYMEPNYSTHRVSGQIYVRTNGRIPLDDADLN